MNRHFHIPRGASCRDVASSVVVVVRFNEHQWEDEVVKWFWNYHCQNHLWAASELGLMKKLKEAYESAPA